MSLREKFRAIIADVGAEPKPASQSGGKNPAALRVRVSKVSIVRGGSVSVVITFGIDEPGARMLDQGALVELLEIAKAPVKTPKPKPGEVVIKDPGEP